MHSQSPSTVSRSCLPASSLREHWKQTFFLVLIRAAKSVEAVNPCNGKVLLYFQWKTLEGLFLAEELDFSQFLFMSTHSVVLRECGRWVCMPPVPVIALRSQAGDLPKPLCSHL